MDNRNEDSLENCQSSTQNRNPNTEGLNREKEARRAIRQHVTFELDVISELNTEMTTTATKTADFKPGFRGWLVVCGCFLVEGLIYGTLRALPVYFLDLQETFQASSSQVSWILSITLAVLHVSGPIVSVLCQSLGCRVIIVAGGILACVGFVVSSFSTNIGIVYLGIGIITGAGFGFAFIPANVCVGEYFQNNSSLAYCICSTGGPIMSFVFAPLFEMLGNQFGWRRAFLVIAGIVLNISVAGMLMVLPPKNKNSVVKQEQIRITSYKEFSVDDETESSEEQVSTQDLGAKSNALESFNRSSLEKKITLDTSDKNWPKKTTGKFALLKNCWFLIYCLTGICIGAGAFTPSVFFVPYLRSIGFNSSQSTLMLSISSAVSLLSSLFAGWISSRPNINILYVDALSFTSLAICCFLPTIIKSYTQLMVFSIALGICTGMVLALPFSVLAEIVGTENLSFGLGLFLLATSISVLLTPPFTGWLVDISGTYGSTFYFAGSSMILGVFTILIIQYGTEVVDKGQTEIATVDQGQSNVSEMLDHHRLSTTFGHLPYQVYIGHENEQAPKMRYRRITRSHSLHPGRSRSASTNSLPSINQDSNTAINLSNINIALVRRKSMF